MSSPDKEPYSHDAHRGSDSLRTARSQPRSNPPSPSAFHAPVDKGSLPDTMSAKAVNAGALNVEAALHAVELQGAAQHRLPHQACQFADDGPARAGARGARLHLLAVRDSRVV